MLISVTMTTYRLPLCVIYSSLLIGISKAFVGDCLCRIAHLAIATTSTTIKHSHSPHDPTIHSKTTIPSRSAYFRYLASVLRRLGAFNPSTLIDWELDKRHHSSTLLNLSTHLPSHTKTKWTWVLGQHTPLKNHTSVKAHRQSHKLFWSLHTQIALRVTNILYFDICTREFATADLSTGK